MVIMNKLTHINAAGARRADPLQMDWQPITSAPFDRDLELAVLDGGNVHALVFPCRRTLDGWVKYATNERVRVQPTHWREWKN